MLLIKKLLTIASVTVILASCGTNRGEDTGQSTPIDSTNMQGTSPATYGGENPANYQDTTLQNSNDTGTGNSRRAANTDVNQ